MPRVTLEQANTLIAKALSYAQTLKVKPLAVVVLDASGHLVAAQRQDNATMFRYDVALGKAWGAVAMGSSSRALAVRAIDNPNFMIALASTAQGKFFAATGCGLNSRCQWTSVGFCGSEWWHRR